MAALNPWSRDATLTSAVRFVIATNLAYFFVEFSVALSIGSVSLFADGVDFLEDAAVNALILLALAWPAKWRARTGMAMAALLLVPGLAALWTAVGKFLAPTVPEALPLTLTGLGAFAVNLASALALVRFRHHKGSLTKAAFLSARNDVLADAAIIVAGLVTAATNSLWPDLVVGIGIAAINAGAAREIVEAALEEHRSQEM